MKKYTGLELIDLGLVFVAGAVYRDRKGQLWRIVNTCSVGTIACDAYRIDEEGDQLEAYSEAVLENDLVEFIEDMSF